MNLDEMKRIYITPEDLKKEISRSTGIPAELLTGSDKNTIFESAEKIISWKQSQNNVNEAPAAKPASQSFINWFNDNYQKSEYSMVETEPESTRAKFEQWFKAKYQKDEPIQTGSGSQGADPDPEQGLKNILNSIVQDIYDNALKDGGTDLNILKNDNRPVHEKLKEYIEEKLSLDLTKDEDGWKKLF